jgi:hypothetical protein
MFISKLYLNGQIGKWTLRAWVDQDQDRSTLARSVCARVHDHEYDTDLLVKGICEGEVHRSRAVSRSNFTNTITQINLHSTTAQLKR